MEVSVIRIIGDIDLEALKKFSEELEAAKPNKFGNIVIELTSPGGDPDVALAFAAKMRLCKHEICIIAHGIIASAAVIILASGDHRMMSKESWVMVHEGSYDDLKGELHQVEKQTRDYRRFEKQWAYLLDRATHTSAAVWTALHKETTYLNAKQCLRMGLIDEII